MAVLVPGAATALSRPHTGAHRRPHIFRDILIVKGLPAFHPDTPLRHYPLLDLDQRMRTPTGEYSHLTDRRVS